MKQARLVPDRSDIIWKDYSSDGLTKAVIKAFREEIWNHYHQEGREFPFRSPRHYQVPYRVVISEIMLQQTQATRVQGKYLEFLKKFPDFKSIERATQAEILEAWKGLGYNRRALALKKIARMILHDHGGHVPREIDKLEEFPWIGPNTAASISTFAFNLPNVFIETNIRTVYLHFFFKNEKEVMDAEILPLVKQTLDTSNPREWYYALMDYGVFLKKRYKNKIAKRGKQYKRAASFTGSSRQARGKILRLVLQQPRSLDEITKHLGDEKPDSIPSILKDMIKEGFLSRDGEMYSIKDS